MEYDSYTMKRNLIIYRKVNNNFSMQGMADLIGISKATYSRLENGNIPDVITYSKVIWFLHSETPRYITL